MSCCSQNSPEMNEKICCAEKAAAAAATLETMKASAENFGFDATWIADLIAKWGPDALSMVVEALRLGFSKEFVIELLSRFGPAVLEFIVSLLNSKNMQLVGDGEIVSDAIVAEQTNIMLLLLEKYLPELMQKFLPILLEKYGPQLIQMVVQAIINAISTKQTA